MTSEPSPPGRQPATIVAFTSHTGGIGRTGVVANLAWILSVAGQRVLVLDSGTEAPHVHEYLRPFHAETPPADQLLGDELIGMLAPAPNAELPARVLGHPNASQLAARRYQVRGFGRIDVVTTDLTVPVGPLSLTQDGSGDGVGLREQIRSTDYDYVLIDGPTDVSDAVVTRLALLCDVVAVCFTPQRSSTVRAAKLAQHIRDAVRVGPSIIGVPLQFDLQDRDRAQQTRTVIQDAFAELAFCAGAPSEPDVPAVMVEIPYQPHDALFDEALAPLLDEPGRENTLSLAYQRLASLVTQGIVDQLPAIPTKLRLQYRIALGLEPEDAQPKAYLLYASEDRVWADWVRVQMERGGVRVARLPQDDEWCDGAGCPNVVVVVSPQLAGSPAGRRAIDLARQTAQDSTDAAPFDLVVIAVSDELAPASLAEAPHIVLAGCAELQARTRLLSHFVLVERPTVGQAPMVFFPGGPGATGSMSNLAPRNLEFVGRDEELEAMRDNFVVAGGVCTWTLTGVAGIGKSEIAKEYAHRFAFDYDLAWWVPAGSRDSARASLAELGNRMELPAIDGVERAVFDMLAAGQLYSRWLLIYDNADEDDTLAGLVPTEGNGHVIVTGRLSTPAPAAEGSQVGPLCRDDCVAMLRSGVEDLATEDAEKAAALVEYLPLSIALATAWMRENAALLRHQGESGERAAAWAAVEFGTRMEQLAQSAQLPGYLRVPVPASMVGTLAVVVKTLQADESGRLALRLAQHCAFLAADGVSVRLLRSPRMLAALISTAADRDALTWDPLELDRVMWTGTRFGLFEVGWERPASLRMHRLVQALVRQLMTADERRACHAEVLQGLAAFAPTDAEGKCEQDLFDFAELQKHLVPSDAAASAEFEVRRWLVDQIAYVYSAGGPDAWQFAVELGDSVLVEWSPTTDSERRLRMRLEFRLSNLYRALGQPADALLAKEESLLQEQRRVLGPTHPRVLKTARGRAAELRSLGRFADARAEERATWLGFCAVLGENHPDTLRAANNLALSLFLAGDTPAALRMDEQNRARRLSLYGPDHPDVWWSACNVGTYLCDLGRHEEALKVLGDSLSHVVSLRSSRGSDELRINELRIQRNRAIALRRSGESLSAFERAATASSSAVLNDETLHRYQALLGSEHSTTRACKLSYALDQHQIGHTDTAVELAEDCLQGYVRSSLDHPFTALCRTNLAVFLRAAGDVEQALEYGRQGQDELCDWLGEQHPWALAARINHARILAELDQMQGAIGLLQSVHDDCREFLVRDHPYTVVVANNLASEVNQWKDVGVDVPVS
jgi:Mrp family chromosome partitioning ATPase/tetratricopeptide (TPR) repeat protein